MQVVYDSCLELAGEAPDYVNLTFGLSGFVKCCRGGQCGHGAVYLDTWPSVTQVLPSSENVSLEIML